jgi:PAS domain S-box-containing protein
MTQFLKKGSMRKFGLGFVDEVPWGTHFCQLYETKKDLTDILVPYFAEGLRNNEFCMWVTSPPLEVEEAKAALREAVPDLDEYVRKAQIEIIPYTAGYLLDGEFDIDRVLQGWVEKEKAALDRGFEGLRVSGNTYWIGRSLWRSFADYEAVVNDVITSHRMLALCTYSLEKSTGMDVVDVLRNHVGALIIKDKEWQLVEDITRRRKTEALYRNVVQTSIDSFWIIDVEGRFLDVNSAFCKLVGYSRDELLKMRIQDVEAKESLKKVLKHIQKIRLKGLDHFETRQRRKNGQVVDIGVVAKYMGDEDGRIFAFAHNITRRKRNEEAIKQSEVRYRELADSVTDPFFAMDSNLRYTYWNKASEALTGIKAKAAIGKHIFDVFSNDKATRRAVKVYKKVIRTKKPQLFVNEYPIGNRTVFFEIHAYPTKDGISVFSRDITERKKAEASLHESQLDLNRAQAVAKTGSWRLDLQRNELRWSDETYRMFGIPKGTPLTYEKFLDTIHVDDRDYVDEKWNTALRGEPYDIEHRIVVDGEVKWVREKAELEFDEHGVLQGGFGTVQDITERKKAEEALKESEEKERARAEELKTILDAVPAAVWIANDPESREIAGNRPFYEILRLPEGVNVSMSAPEGERPTNYRVLKDWRELKPEEMPVQLAAKGEVLRDYEFAIEFTDGTTRHLLGNACPIYDAEGKPRGSVAAFIDITERKAMQDKLEDYSKHLENLVEEKTKQLKDAERLAAIGETAGMIGHDIRNPLQAIIGELYLSKDWLQSLPENKAKQELADSMRVIEEQTFYIDKIVTDLQDYAKPLAPHIVEVDLESIMESVLSTVDIPENIQVAYSIEKGYPKLMIDSSYMKRILTNLVNNAVQAMPNGGAVTINANYKDYQAFITVEDTGEGISEEAKNRIFKPLFTTKAKGQGFGLAVAKKLTEALNGTITFESEKEKGTKFIIQFPQNPHKNNAKNTN